MPLVSCNCVLPLWALIQTHWVCHTFRELYKLYIQGPDDQLDESQFAQVLMTAGEGGANTSTNMYASADALHQ